MEKIGKKRNKDIQINSLEEAFFSCESEQIEIKFRRMLQSIYRCNILTNACKYILIYEVRFLCFSFIYLHLEKLVIYFICNNYNYEVLKKILFLTS